MPQKGKGRVVISVSVPLDAHERITRAADLTGETISGFFLQGAEARASATFLAQRQSIGTPVAEAANATPDA